VYDDQLQIIMANVEGWASSQHQEMSDFDNGDSFPAGDGFNIGELSGLDGAYNDIVLCIRYSKTVNC
jgi:hypothetical protein